MILAYICLFMIFAVTVATTNGMVRVFTFSAALLFFVGVTKKGENAILLVAAVLPNTELLNGSFMGISILRIVFILCIIIIMIRYVNTKGQIKILVPIWFYILWLIYIVANQVFINGTFSLQSILSIVGMMLISIAMQVIIYGDKAASEKFILMIFVGFSFIVMIAYVELLFGRTFFYSLWTGAERYRYGIMRVGSTVADPNNVCFYLVPFFFWTRIDSVKSTIPCYFRIIIQTMTLLIVLLTSSRAGLVALLIGLFFCFFGRRKVVLLTTIPIIGIVFNYLSLIFEILMNSAVESTSFRNYIVEQCLLLWNKNRLFGIGINNIMRSLGYSSTSLNTMNTFVFILTGLGIIGLTFYVLYWGIMIKKNIVSWVKNKRITMDQLYVLACVIATLVMAYTLDTFYMMLMWIMPAMLITASGQLEVMKRRNE